MADYRIRLVADQGWTAGVIHSMFLTRLLTYPSYAVFTEYTEADFTAACEHWGDKAATMRRVLGRDLRESPNIEVEHKMRGRWQPFSARNIESHEKRPLRSTEERRAMYDEIARLRARGVSDVKIAQRLNIGRTTIYRLDKTFG